MKKYVIRKQQQNTVLYTVITVLLLSTVFLAMISFLYTDAHKESEETLHVQTKQIKDDLTLQLVSDHENLETMANFAAKLYADGEDYQLLFNAFKPIGLIENIGILNPDNTFSTKIGTIDLDGKISFEYEAARKEYVSGRLKDLTRDDNYEIIRSAAPIVANGKTVGILYGVVKLETLGKKYKEMVQALNAQLFVYEQKTGDLIIDTIHDTLGNISFLQDRKYNDGYSYEQIINTSKGFSSFASKYTDQDMHLHYSPVERLGWTIMLARYETHVFAQTRRIVNVLFITFGGMFVIMALYLLIMMASERYRGSILDCASEVRRILLETNTNQNNIALALQQVCSFGKARSAVFFDTDGESFAHVDPAFESVALSFDNRNYFNSELFRAASDLHKANSSSVLVMRILANAHLEKSNPVFYEFLQQNQIKEVSFVAVIDTANRIVVLGVVNPRRSKAVRSLAEKVAVCFSIALSNKQHLRRTEHAATTDPLTGALNRSAFQKEVLLLDQEQSQDFSCIFIDVNELHLRNNKYGHAAGDEMLRYIANTLKDVFYGHNVYRMGGDEFLVFTKNTALSVVQERLAHFTEQLKPRDYKVAVGLSHRAQNTSTEEAVREAEVNMYDAKAEYYQNKNQKPTIKETGDFVFSKTGIAEIDMLLSTMKDHYHGAYRVSLQNDTAHRVLMPAYLGFHENEQHFSTLFSQYIDSSVNPDFHRAILSFLNYDALRNQLAEGKTPRFTYNKTTGESVTLSVYNLNPSSNEVDETLWVFSKE